MEDMLGLFAIHSSILTRNEPTKNTCLENSRGKRKRCYVIACISLWEKSKHFRKEQSLGCKVKLFHAVTPSCCL